MERGALKNSLLKPTKSLDKRNLCIQFITLVYTLVCWYPALRYAGVSTEEAEGFPLNFIILTAMALLAPACLSLCPTPCVLIPDRRQLDHCRKKYQGRFVPLGQGILMPGASSASLKFRSKHLILHASVPYTVNEALSKSHLDKPSYMSNEDTF